MFERNNMLKKIVFASLLMGFAAASSADEAAIRKAIQESHPKVKVESVSKTPINGLYEVVLDSEVVYTDENFSYFLVGGHMFEQKSRKDLTGERLFNSLPFDQAIKVVRGNGSRKLVVFSDPDCPFCKKLEKEGLLNLTDVTIYTFLFPLDSLHPEAAGKAKSIWCAPDRAKAWRDWIFNGQLPKGAASCDTPLEKTAALGRKFDVTSTPTLLFPDGKQIKGAYPAKDIEKALIDANSKKP
jgi:thiol:disulfide interchange protein DsbC